MGTASTRYVALLCLYAHLNNATRVLDGPALRSTAMITYANWLLDNGNTTFVSQTLWPIIELDVNYVMNYWNQST